MSKLQPHDVHAICRLLAAGELSQRQIASRFGITQNRISEINRQQARRIDAIRAAMDDEFAGLWIADKTARLANYEGDVEALASEDGVEAKRARAAIMKIVAEEMGQLPARLSLTVNPVIHIIEGVNMEDLT